MPVSYNWVWSPLAHITGLVGGCAAHSDVPVFSPWVPPWILDEPACRIHTSQNYSMVRSACSAICVNSLCIILPSICIDCDWKGLIFQCFSYQRAVIFQLYKILDPNLIIPILNRTLVCTCIVRILSFTY